MGSHTLTELSFEPETISAFCGCHARHLTSQPCDFPSSPLPTSSRSSEPRSKSHTLTVESSAHVAYLASVGQYARSRIGVSGCASNSLTQLSVVCQYLRMPAWSPEIIHSSRCDHTATRTAVSCACCVVSKLNESPLHSVNIPLCVPVSSRRPSDVHTHTFTGQRSLFDDVCTNLEQTPEHAEPRYAAGARRSVIAASWFAVEAGAWRTPWRKIRSFSSTIVGAVGSTVRRGCSCRIRRPSNGRLGLMPGGAWP